MPIEPKYLRIARYIKNRIDSGDLKPGEALPTQLEMAQQFGVGRLTVRQALQQVVNEGYVKAVQGSGTYVRDRQSPQGDQRRLGLIHACGDFPNPHFLNVIEAASTAARQLDAMTMLYAVNGEEQPGAIQAWLEANAINVAIAIGVIPPGLLERIYLDGYPLVCAIQRPVSGVEGQVCYVGTDHPAGVRQAIDHLRQGGHGRIALVTDRLHEWESSQTERVAAYQAAVAPASVVAVDDREGLYGTLRGRSRYTAVLATKDTTALKVLQVATQMSIPVPQQLAVIGFGGSELGRYSIPPLTTMAEGFDQIGRCCIEQAVKMAKDRSVPDDQIVAPQLTIRESCGISQ